MTAEPLGFALCLGEYLRHFERVGEHPSRKVRDVESANVVANKGKPVATASVDLGAAIEEAGQQASLIVRPNAVNFHGSVIERRKGKGNHAAECGVEPRFSAVSIFSGNGLAPTKVAFDDAATPSCL